MATPYIYFPFRDTFRIFYVLRVLLYFINRFIVSPIPHWLLPAVCDLTHDGRWSTYDVSVLKLTNVSFRGKCARLGNTLKLPPSPTKLARLGHFPPASQAGRLAGPVFFVYVCSLIMILIFVLLVHRAKIQ
jgi:hypothetical protein